MHETYDIIDTIDADSIEELDQIIIDGDLIEVIEVTDTADRDEIKVRGYNNSSGDVETFSLYWGDRVDVWSV